VRRATPGDRRSLIERLDDNSSVKADEVASGPDLPAEVKVRIVRLHRRLKKLGPYEILGLGRGADKTAIRRAYYTASKELHPDRYYGKDLGDFREKLGDIFARLTEAFQTLEQQKK
jgi:DnaJ-class molecular chaperone